MVSDWDKHSIPARQTLYIVSEGDLLEVAGKIDRHTRKMVTISVTLNPQGEVLDLSEEAKELK